MTMMIRTKAHVTKKLTKMKKKRIVTQKVRKLILGINYEKKLSIT